MNTATFRRGLGRPLIGAAVALLAVGLSSCGSAEETLSKNNTGRGSQTHIVEIKDFKFVPATISVNQGDVIIWRNLDVVPHTATAKENQWDSGALSSKEEWALTVNSVGSTDYICAYHPAMKGRIVVSGD